MHALIESPDKVSYEPPQVSIWIATQQRDWGQDVSELVELEVVLVTACNVRTSISISYQNITGPFMDCLSVM